jgi:hypothetical protein
MSPRCALAWLLYWLGDAVSYILAWLDRRGAHDWGFCRLYSGLMVASLDAQGDGAGPWEAIPCCPQCNSRLDHCVCRAWG